MLEFLQNSYALSKNQNYGEALHYFNNISDYDVTEKFLEYKENLVSSICQITLSSFRSDSLKSLLSIEVQDARSSLSYEDVRPNYRSLSIAIKEVEYNSGTILSAIKCSLYSPFQLDLLLATCWLLNNKGNLDLCTDNSENLHSFSTILRTIYDKPFRAAVYGSLVRIYEEIFDVKSFFKELELLEVDKIFEYPDLDFLYDIPSKNYTYNNICESNIGQSLSIGTIFLNEQKYISLSLEQHYPLCIQWTLVEGACQGYPPRKVTKNGLSLDRSQLLVRLFPDRYKKINYIKHGWTKSDGEDAKSELRNRYMSVSYGSVLLVLDADEFYFPDDLLAVKRKFDDPSISSVTLPQVHFWKDLQKFITGEYYDISHTRFFRLIPGAAYVQNHNFPEVNGILLNKINNVKIKRTIIRSSLLENTFEYNDYCCFHMGFAKDFDDMRDKSDYYINRGEADTRRSTTKSRSAWFDDDLPDKCIVRTWGGSIPVCLIEESGDNK